MRKRVGRKSSTLWSVLKGKAEQKSSSYQLVALQPELTVAEAEGSPTVKTEHRELEGLGSGLTRLLTI